MFYFCIITLKSVVLHKFYTTHNMLPDDNDTLYTYTYTRELYYAGKF